MLRFNIQTNRTLNLILGGVIYAALAFTYSAMLLSDNFDSDRPPVASTTPSPAVVTSPTTLPSPAPSEAGAAPANSFSASKLIIPAAGVKPEQLVDTFSSSRSEGRSHNAIDIMAPRGTPALAAVDGAIVKLTSSEKGGISIYQLSADQKFVFYYAHLDRYAEGLKEGQSVKQGETIGYVGDTGNVEGGNYHLHFAIWIISDPKQFWHGTNINPYPLLR